MSLQFSQPSPTTIGYLITRFDEFGGAQIHVRDLALAAQANGHRAIVFAGALGEAATDARAKGLEVIEVPSLVREISPAKDISAVRDISSLIKSHGVDLIHCHSSKAGIIGRMAARKAKVPAVFTAHGWAFTEGVSPKKRAVYRLIEKAMAPLADRIITVSEYDRNLALASKVGNSDRMVAIQNGMPFLPPAHRSERAAGAPLRLIMVARIQTPKDHSQLLRALGSIASENWTLSIVGAGDDRHLRELATSFGIEDKVEFLGQRSDVPALLQSHDVFCLISNWEGFPLTIVEAMRAGMPVIASNVGGCAEAVEADKTGIVVPRGGCDEIARAVQSYIEDPERVRAHGEAGRAAFDERFTFDIMAAKTFAVYEDALSKIALPAPAKA